PEVVAPRRIGAARDEAVAPERRVERIPERAEAGEVGVHERLAEARVVGRRVEARLLPPAPARPGEVPVADERIAEEPPAAQVEPAGDERRDTEEGRRRRGGPPRARALQPPRAPRHGQPHHPPPAPPA